MLEKIFKLKQHNTNVKTEVMAGVTTFMTMAYILAVNPGILGEAGMDSTAVLLATAIASFIGTVCMALMANMPFVLSAGMGLNAYLAYTVVQGMGYSWQVALLAVFAEGIIFILLSLTHVREAIFNAIPLTLKRGVSVGIGLFIAFIGLQNAGLAVDASTLVTITSFTDNFSTHGICALLAVIGLLLTAVLHIRGIKGSILIGIIATWVLGIICQLTGLYVPNPDTGFYSLIPTAVISFDFSRLGETFGQCFRVDWSVIRPVDFVVVIIAFLFVDLFDTLGTLIGVAAKANMLDEEGRLPNVKPALLADAIGTSVGAVLGTSTVTTFVESASGVEAGGRTGLTTFVCGVLFLACIFIAPIAAIIPAAATSAALIYVGVLMLQGLKNVDFNDLDQTVPVCLMLIAMPVSGSIGHGIGLGLIAYTLIKVFGGKAKEVSWLTYAISALFLIKFFLVV